MKQESMKHLQRMHELMADNQVIREMIEAIIRIEDEPQRSKKFSLWDYVSKDDLRPSMNCILHDSGYKVATDGHILAILKEDYEAAMEGRQMRKDGTFFEDGKYPNWRMVIPDPKKMGSISVRLDFAGIREFEKDYKAKKKLNKNLEGYVKVGVSYFNLDLLIKAVRFMEYVGTDELMISPDGKRAALAVAGDSRLVVMPCIGSYGFNENEVCYGL